MDERKKYLALGIGALFLFCISCEQTTVEEDMNAYCDCVEKNGGLMNEECVEIAEQMTLKYEYDPEASDYIEKSMRNCGTE